MMRIVVVLPAPFGPRKPRICPGAAVNETSWTAVEVAVPLAQVRDFDHVRDLDAGPGREIRARYLNGAVSRLVKISRLAVAPGPDGR